MERNDKPYFRGKLRLNRSKITFLAQALEMLFKETSLDPNVAVTLEKHLFSTWLCKPDKYYTALPKMHRYFWSESSNKRETKVYLSCALKWYCLSKEMLFASIRSALS